MSALFVLVLSCLGQPPSFSPDPDAAEIVTSDIDLFRQAYDAAYGDGKPAARTFAAKYLRAGSPGLKAFTELRIGNAQALVETIEAHPKYYKHLREAAKLKADLPDTLRAHFRKFKEIYPDAIFPNVYFVIGRMNSGGTISRAGIMIGTEMYGLTEGAPKDELSAWHREVLSGPDRLPTIVVHELMHFQQRHETGEKTLLHKAFYEGSADFVAELVVGDIINTHLHEWAANRERSLWREFTAEMDGTDYKRWLFQGAADAGRPADLGYYIGYKIAEAYYAKQIDKTQALRDILQFADAAEILRKSGYDGGAD